MCIRDRLLVAIGWINERQSMRREITNLGMHSNEFQKRIESVIEAEEFEPEKLHRSTIRSFIVAVSDPEPRVAAIAENALIRISGIDGGFGLTEESNADQQFKVMSKWCEWYLKNYLGGQ